MLLARMNDTRCCAMLDGEVGYTPNDGPPALRPHSRPAPRPPGALTGARMRTGGPA